MISPVCSRLKEHISMMDGHPYKERLFLLSPMPNQLGWPLASPAFDSCSRYPQALSTQFNTTANSKRGTATSNEKETELKSHSSPFPIKRFMDADGAGDSMGDSHHIHAKSLQYSDFKLFPAVP
jgi:hypothetical protein